MVEDLVAVLTPTFGTPVDVVVGIGLNVRIPTF